MLDLMFHSGADKTFDFIIWDDIWMCDLSNISRLMKL